MFVSLQVCECACVLRSEDFRNMVHLLCHRVFHRWGAHQSGKSCPSSLREPYISISTALGLQECAAMPGIFLGFWEIKLRCSCLQGKFFVCLFVFLTTELSLHPLLLSFSVLFHQLFLLHLWNSVTCSPCCLQTHSVAKASLELWILPFLTFLFLALELYVCATTPWPLTCFPWTSSEKCFSSQVSNNSTHSA